MKLSVRNKNRILSGALLLIFSGYAASVTLFPHSHIIDGKVVSHSHPYSKVPDTGGHKHTASQHQTIAHLSVLLMLTAVFAASAHFFAADDLFRDITEYDIAFVSDIPLITRRGPPLVC